jgi:hypothetical protein
MAAMTKASRFLPSRRCVGVPGAVRLWPTRLGFDSARSANVAFARPNVIAFRDHVPQWMPRR